MTTGLSCVACLCLKRSEMKEEQHTGMGKRNGSQQGQTWRHSVSFYIPELNCAMAAATAISPFNRCHQEAFGGYYFTLSPACSLSQMTCSKLLKRSHISKQHNLITCSFEELNRSSFSLDWGSVLNNSTVLGDLSDSRILRVSSDLFFREWRTSGRR